VRRGEVWWVDLPRPFGRRPAVLLSRDEAYELRTDFTVALCTSHAYGIDTEVPLGPDDGLPGRCVVNLDMIQTIRSTRFDKAISLLSREKMAAVETALQFALGLDYPTRPSSA